MNYSTLGGLRQRRGHGEGNDGQASGLPDVVAQQRRVLLAALLDEAGRSG